METQLGDEHTDDSCIHDKKYRITIESAIDGYWHVDADGSILEVNDAYCKLSGYTCEELLAMKVSDLDINESPEQTATHIRKVMETGSDRFETRHLTKDGRILDIEVSVTHSQKAGRGIFCFLRDITEQKMLAEEREITIDLLSLFNASNNLTELISSVTELLQKWSGCEAVGIRLKEGDDYPYFQTKGFPDSFVILENSLCVCDLNGQILRDEHGNPVLECMCGNILKGRFDPQRPFFTRYGSFWTNSTSQLLASTSESDRQARTRNRCNGEGYESVALIPLRIQDETFGLIQLNDPRQGCFTPEKIAFFERLANSIALALSQRRSQTAVKKNKEKLESILRAAPAGIGVVSDRVLTDVNLRVCEMTGYTYSELIGSNARILYPSQEDFDYVGTEKYRQISEKGTGSVETRWQRKDGTVIDILLSSTPIDTSDLSKGVTFTALDITERKRMENALRESEERYRMLIENSSEAILLTGPDGSIFAANPHACHIFGRSEEEICRAGRSGLVDLSDPRLPVYLKEREKNGRARGELNCLRKDGTIFPADISSVLFKDSEGCLRTSMIINDITERKRAEEKLAEESIRRHIFFEQSRDGIVVLDENGKVVEANQRYAQMLGYEPEEVLELHVWDWDVRWTKEELQEIICRVGMDGDKFETLHRRKDGTCFHVEISSNAAWLAGQKLIFCSCRDITERKLAEEEMERYKQIVSSTKDGVSLVDADYRYVLINDAYEIYSGKKRDDLIGLTFADYLGDDVFYNEIKENLDRCLKGETIRFNMWVNYPTLGKRFVDVTYFPYVNKKGDIAGIVVNTCDKTEYKAIMEALQESEERLKLANKATNDVIWDWDILNDTQQWNEAGKIVFGWSDIVSSPQKASWWADRIHPDDRHRVEEGFFEVVNDPENDHWQDEYKFLKADGNYVRVMDRGYVLRNEQGQALRMIGAMLDITELKEMQERLQKSEQRLASVIRTQQEMICRFLPDTTLTFVNDAFCRAVGMSEDELVGAKFIEMLPESEHDRVFENLSRTNAENPTRTYSHPAILKNRKEVWQEWTDYAILDSENNVIEYQSVGIDITEKREADRKLKESAARIKAIIDTIPDMLFVIDRDGYFREYYASDEDKLVLRPRRIVGANIRDMFDEEESKRHLRAYEHCIDSGQLQVLEYYLDLGDRRSFYEARISPLDGNTVLATIRDMTDYKQLTESLEESRRKYQLLVDNQNDLLIQFDLEGRIIFVNPEYCKTFGMSEEELKGKSFFPLICEDDHSNVKNSLKKVLSPPYTTRHEERAMTVEGWRWFSWSAKAILSEQGQVTSIISVGRDITERRQAEGEILRMNRLLESTRAAQSSYIISDDPRETFDSLLDILLSLTGSEFGFLDEVLRDENGSPYKLSLSLFNIAWSPETQELYEGLRERRLEFRNLQNLSGLPAVTGKPVIANDAPNDPRSGGLPPGHPRIHNFMGLPMYFGDKLVGVAGIANRDGGYSEEMVSFLDPFLSACASIIHATRSHSKEREFVATLKESEARYRSLAEENAVLLEKSRRDAEYKEILLHEVNHRVKNNLAAIIGLLYAQQRSIGNDMKEDFRKVMKELAHRIETLALVHNLLSSTKWNSLSLPWLFKEILQSATKIVPEGKCLKYSVSDIDARVPAQLANSLSLIIFELTTNTIKHALRDRELVNVTITNEWTPQGLLIQYRDDGPGFPDEVIKMEKVNLGLDLVRTLASHDLQGELILNNASGAVVEIRLGKDTGIKCVDDAMEKENA